MTLEIHIPMPEDKWRDFETEKKLSKVVEQISSDYDVRPPEIAVVPDYYVLQVSDGETDLATYKPALHRIYISPDLTLFDLCHEMAHHIENVYREKEGTVEKGVEEWQRSQKEPWEQQPAEKRAENFALHCTVKYKGIWSELFGDKRFMPWQRGNL